jgi:hypothetical protein
MRRRDVVRIVLAVGLTAGAGTLLAQDEERFAARLSWVPISGAERADVAGHGSAAASLSGARLSITGSFEGLPTPATAVRLRRGVATGARGRGPAIAELNFVRAEGGERGEFLGEVDLTADQLAALRAGYVYLQLYAEKGVPEDNSVLWGWLLPAK